jgi:hypothetical protein
MRDRDIRCCLRAQLEAMHMGEEDTLILDELGLLQGAARVDMAVVNGTMAAWEIKSERDTLRRLAAQADAYGKVFDYVTLVAAPAHLLKVEDALPAWWGISVAAEDSDGTVVIEPRRKPSINPGTSSRALAELLWREEALAVLATRGLASGLRSKPRRALWSAIAEHIPAVELAEEVRAALKARQGWRAAPQLR